jgi:hypothetical protein
MALSILIDNTSMPIHWRQTNISNLVAGTRPPTEKQKTKEKNEETIIKRVRDVRIY